MNASTSAPERANVVEGAIDAERVKQFESTQSTERYQLHKGAQHHD